MHVKNILSAKGGNVVSIEPTATLETAVRTPQRNLHHQLLRSGLLILSFDGARDCWRRSAALRRYKVGL